MDSMEDEYADIREQIRITRCAGDAMVLPHKRFANWPVWAECVVCIDKVRDPLVHYADSKFQMLKCTHMVCSKGCLDSLKKSQKEANLSLHCPKCRSIFEEKDIQPRYINPAKLVELSENMAIKKCTYCVLDIPAVSWCEECGQFLCAPCTDYHPIYSTTRTHILSNDLEGRSPRREETDPPLNKKFDACSLHNQQRTMYCRICVRKLCPGCVTSHDNSHQVTVWEDLVQETIRMAKHYLQQSTKIIELCELGEQELERRIEYVLNQEKDELIQQAGAQVSIILSRVMGMEMRSRKEITHAIIHRAKQLNANRIRLSGYHSSFSQFSTFVNDILSSNDENVLMEYGGVIKQSYESIEETSRGITTAEGYESLMVNKTKFRMENSDLKTAEKCIEMLGKVEYVTRPKQKGPGGPGTFRPLSGGGGPPNLSQRPRVPPVLTAQSRPSLPSLNVRPPPPMISYNRPPPLLTPRGTPGPITLNGGTNPTNPTRRAVAIKRTGVPQRSPNVNRLAALNRPVPPTLHDHSRRRFIPSPSRSLQNAPFTIEYVQEEEEEETSPNLEIPSPDVSVDEEDENAIIMDINSDEDLRRLKEIARDEAARKDVGQRADVTEDTDVTPKIPTVVPQSQSPPPQKDRNLSKLSSKKSTEDSPQPTTATGNLEKDQHVEFATVLQELAKEYSSGAGSPTNETKAPTKPNSTLDTSISTSFGTEGSSTDHKIVGFSTSLPVDTASASASSTTPCRSWNSTPLGGSSSEKLVDEEDSISLIPLGTPSRKMSDDSSQVSQAQSNGTAQDVDEQQVEVANALDELAAEYLAESTTTKETPTDTPLNLNTETEISQKVRTRAASKTSGPSEGESTPADTDTAVTTKLLDEETTSSSTPQPQPLSGRRNSRKTKVVVRADDEPEFEDGPSAPKSSKTVTPRNSPRKRRRRGKKGKKVNQADEGTAAENSPPPKPVPVSAPVAVAETLLPSQTPPPPDLSLHEPTPIIATSPLPAPAPVRSSRRISEDKITIEWAESLPPKRERRKKILDPGFVSSEDHLRSRRKSSFVPVAPVTPDQKPQDSKPEEEQVSPAASTSTPTKTPTTQEQLEDQDDTSTADEPIDIKPIVHDTSSSESTLGKRKRPRKKSSLTLKKRKRPYVSKSIPSLEFGETPVEESAVVPVFPRLSDQRMKITNTDANEDFCGVCRDGGTDVILGSDMICCDNCPKIFHLVCHMPTLKVIPEGDFKCNWCQTLEEACDPANQAEEFLRDEKAEGLHSQPQEFFKACKFLSELYKSDCVYFVRNAVQQLRVKVDHSKKLDVIRLRLTLNDPKPFRTVVEMLVEVEKMFYAFNNIIVASKIEKFKEILPEFDKKFTALIKEYYGEYRKMHKNLEGYVSDTQAEEL